MEIDYVRVYQAGAPKIGCDPPDFPTQDYISRHLEAYTNPNYTLWGGGDGGYGKPWPRNKLNPGGCDTAPSLNPGSPTNAVPKAPFFPKKKIGENQPECDISDWNSNAIQ